MKTLAKLLLLWAGIASAAAPTFTVSPTVTAQTAVSYTLGYTASQPTTFYSVAYQPILSAPNCTQIQAGQNQTGVAALAAANEAVTGADTTVLGSALSRPVHNIASCLHDAGGDSAVVTLTGKLLNAPSGKQHVLLASISVTSWLNEFNVTAIPPVAVADIVEYDLAVTPGGGTISPDTAGDTHYAGTSARQRACYRIYDASLADWMAGGGGPCGAGYGNLWFNNLLPIPPEPNAIVIFVPQGSPMDPVDLSPYCTDPENDAITVTNVSVLPPNLTIASSILQGTSTVRGISSNIILKCSDITGDSVTWQ